MSVRYTADPSSVPRGNYAVGAPYRHLPAILICGAGEERICGKTWVANTEADLLVKLAEKRDHEATCKGGLIVATGIGGLHG